MARLLNALRDELITAGLVRKPGVAGPKPPMWLSPLGVPAAGEGQGVEVGPDLVVGAYETGGVSPAPMGQWSMYPNVEVRLRSAKDKSTLAEDLEQAITLRLLTRWGGGLGTSPPLLGGTVSVIDAQQVVARQLLTIDFQGYEHVVTYGFQLYRPGT